MATFTRANYSKTTPAAVTRVLSLDAPGARLARYWVRAAAAGTTFRVRVGVRPGAPDVAAATVTPGAGVLVTGTVDAPGTITVEYDPGAGTAATAVYAALLAVED